MQPMSLRARLNLLVLLAIIPLAALLVYTNVDERRRDIETAKNDALIGLQSVKIDLGLRVEEARELLLTLAQVSEVRSSDPTACAARLQELHKWYPDYSEFGLAGPNGDIVCSSRSASTNTNQKGTAWFQHALMERAFSIGDYQLEPETGKPSLTFSLPVLDDLGKAQGVVYAVTRISALREPAAETLYSSQADLLVLDRHGTILDRQPQPENWAGKTLTQTPLIQAILTQQNGIVEMNGIDGIERLYAFAPVGNSTGTGLYVCTGILTEIVFDEANKTLLLNLLALIPITALALVTASFFANVLILRHVNGLRETAQRLRRGDLSARSQAISQTIELDELALTFNEMAAALEQRETQRRAAEEIMQAVFEGTTDNIVVKDRQGRYLLANAATARSLGLAIQDILGKDDTALYPPETAQLLLAADRQVIASGQIQTLEETISLPADTRTYHSVKAPYRDAHGDVIGVIGVSREVTQLKQSTQAQQLLAETARLLADSLDDESRLAKVAQLLIADLADWCAIEVVNVDHTVGRVATEHRDPAKAALAEELYRRYPPDWDAPAGASEVLRSGQPQLFPNVMDESFEVAASTSEHLKILRELELTSAIIVPLNAYGLTLGAMTLGWSTPNRPYTSADVALAEVVASRCALALDNARLYRAESAARAAAEVAHQRLAFLAGASRVLMSSTEMTTQLDSFAQYIVPTLADWCTINLIEPDGSIRLATAIHRDAGKTSKISDLVTRYPTDPVAAGTLRVLRTGLAETSSLISRERSGQMDDPEDYEHLLEELGGKSCMIVPLRTRGVVSGTLTLVSVNAGRPYTQADLSLAEELATYAALAIDGARSYQEVQQLNAELDQRVKERTALLQANNEKLQEQIAERLHVEAELAEVQQQQAQGRESERSHLARELHDGPVQDLYGISYRLAVTKDELRQGVALEQFAAAQTELQHVIQTLRNISSELRPPTLTSFGLKVAIQSHAGRFQADHPELRIQLDLASDRQQLPEAVRLALFRIYQQMLSNVMRHAQAHRVDVRLALDIHEVTLEIQDDGQGFVVPRRWIDLARRGHLGIIGAAERAEALDGTLQVISAPGEGTRISVCVPLDSSQPRDTTSPLENAQ